ncbi:MAG: glycosyltransferase family 4 protein [Desulfarculaceae bacterium]|nr:glycosyltransferase family 4 protein [Desulfarculaceae bacterium]
MKLLLWHWGRRGGGPMYTYEMAKAMAALPSLEVYLSLSRQSELWRASQDLGLPGWDVDTYTDHFSALRACLRLPRLRSSFGRYLRRENFDWVCTTMTHLWDNFMLGQVRASGARRLLVLHDALLHPGERDLVRARLLRRETRSADAVVTLSNYVRDQAVKHFGLAPGSIQVIPHGPFFYGKPSLEPRSMPRKRPLRVLFFGRILTYKGLDLLLEAMNLLRLEQPRLELVVAGQGRLTQSQTAALDNLGATVINRWLAAEEVSRIIQHGDILVAPYTSSSQSGVLPLAYAHALPVVATPVGGLREQVLDGQTGLLARGVNAPALAEAIARLAGDPELYGRLSAGAMRYVAQSVAWPLLAGQMVDCMREWKPA